MTYQFDVEDAVAYGVDPAILIYALKWWIRKNATEGRNINTIIIDNEEVARTWTYFRRKDREKLFPFWNEDKYYRIVQRLVDKKVLVRGDFNKMPQDRTMWLAIVDEDSFLELSDNSQNREMNQEQDGGNPQKCEMQSAKVQTAIPESAEALPVNKPINKPFEEGEAGASAPSDPLPQETDLQSKDSSLGQDHGGNGSRRSQDPVEVAYNQIYEELFHLLPNPDKDEFTKRRSLLRTWRGKGFTDNQLIGILKVAPEDPWLKENFYLSTVVSHKQVDKILRKHPNILKTPEKQKPRDPCPVCGCTEVVAGSCGTCHFDLHGGDRKPESIRDWRLQAIWRGALKPRTGQEKADAEAWHQRRITETEEIKKQKTQLAEVAA